VVTSSQSQAATLMTQLGAMVDERPTVTEQQAQEIDSEAKHRADLAFAVSMVEACTAGIVSPGPCTAGPCA
jgi:hypothetical protein